MSLAALLVRLSLTTSILLATQTATAQASFASGIDGGGAGLESSADARHQVSIGQVGGSGALVDADDRPRLVGGIGGALAASAVPEPGSSSAIALAILGLAALRRGRLTANPQRVGNMEGNRS